MENKDEVCRYNGKPRFRIVDVIDKHGISKEDLIYLNRHGYFRRVPFAEVIPEFNVALDPGRRLQLVDLFREPFTVEVVGAGFAKPANARYYTLRFLRVLKVYNDRSFRDSISFKEMQEMAKRCVEMPYDQEQEERSWFRRLGGYEQVVEGSRTSSPSDDSVSVADVHAGRQGIRQQEKVETAVGPLRPENISIPPLKRERALELLHGDSTFKRAKRDGIYDDSK
uniref:Uncharacterized protein n=1 Tax=Bionectria ochroleuca TaxID=29856 RepID=A0A8H7K726_BIOOC